MPWFVEKLIIVGSVVLVMGLIYALSARGRARVGADGRQRIRMGRGVAVFFLLLGLALTVLPLYAALVHGAGIAALMVAGMGAACAFVFGSMLTPAYDVAWDDGGLEGPVSYGIWPFGPARAEMGYDRIETVGMDWASSWFVEDAQGTRIRWSGMYSGYPALMQQIEAKRPDLFPDEPQEA